MLRKIKNIVSPKLRDFLLCILSAILLALSFPNVNCWPLAWFAFVPLFLAIQNKSKAKAFLLSYLTGIIFWLGIIYWLIHVTLAGMIVLVLYLALYFGMFGLVFSSIEQSLPAGRQGASSIEYLFIPSLWVILEYIRSHLFTGFPWALLGYSQYLNLPVIQFADIAGVWGVSFLVMMINVAIYLATSHKPQATSYKSSTLRGLVFSGVIFICVLSYGYYKLYLRPTAYGLRPTKISVIQGNIPQEFKWDPEAKDYILEKYLNITRNVNKDRPDLIIWPEAALPVVLEEEPIFIEQVKKLAKEIKISILLGVVNAQNDHYYNSALLISSEGEILTKYYKLHLVPFGEYIPFRKTLRFLETIVPIGDFTAGREYTLFRVQSTEYRVQSKFSVLICFEDLFPELSREFRKRGADYLVNITNDAWFGKTSAPYQHHSMVVFRAVENRVPVARAANTGVTSVIGWDGRIGRQTGIFTRGFVVDPIQTLSAGGRTFYTRHGDLFAKVIMVLALVLLVGAGVRKEGKGRVPGT